MSSATTYRTCPRSGLQFEANAEKLMLANAVAAVVFLLIGGILAIGVVLTRWPAIHWLEADTFYQVLTAHGIDMLIFWIIFFEIAVLYFCSSTLLRCRLATPKIAWLAFALMVIGAVTNNVAVYQGGSSVMMTSYVPMMAAPSFYLGLILFAVGALIGCFVFLGTLVVAKRDKTYQGSVPLVTFGAITACIIAVFTIASGAIILIPTFLMSVGLIERGRPAGLPHHLVGLRPLVAADQRGGAHLDLVRGGGDRLRRQADERARQPRRLPALHPVPATGQRAPPAGRPGPVHRLEGRQHQLLHVLRGAGLDDPRPDHPRRDGSGAARQGLQQGPVRVAAQGALGQPGVLGRVHLDHRLRLPRRHLGRDDGHRAAQHDHPQHHLRAGALPRHGGGGHHAVVHGADLLPDPGAVQARDDQPRAWPSCSPTCSACRCTSSAW